MPGDLRENGVDGGAVVEIQGPAPHRLAGGLDFPHDALERFAVDVDRRYPRPFIGKELGGGFPIPLAAPVTMATFPSIDLLSVVSPIYFLPAIEHPAEPSPVPAMRMVSEPAEPVNAGLGRTWSTFLCGLWAMLTMRAPVGR